MNEKAKEIWCRFFQNKIISKDFAKNEIWKVAYKQKTNINGWDIIRLLKTIDADGPENSIIVSSFIKKKIKRNGEFHVGWYIYKIVFAPKKKAFVAKKICKADFDESVHDKRFKVIKKKEIKVTKIKEEVKLKKETRIEQPKIDTGAIKNEILLALREELKFLQGEKQQANIEIPYEEVERFEDNTTGLWIGMSISQKWEKLYDQATVAYDFSGAKMEKNEYRNGTHDSWDVLYYDGDRPEKGFLLANEQTIVKMNGQSTFWIGNTQYEIFLHNGKYSIKSNTSSVDLTDPLELQKEINHHLFSFNETKTLLNQEFFSLLIEFPVFPRALAENLQHLIDKFFAITPLLENSYLYLINSEDDPEMVNLQMRYYFKYDNNNSYGVIFDLSVILRSYLSLVRENLKMYNLLGNQNIGFYSLYLDQKILGLKYISWYTHDKINLINNFPKPEQTYDRELVINPNIYHLLKQSFDQYGGFRSFTIDNRKYFQYDNYLENIEKYINDVFPKKEE